MNRKGVLGGFWTCLTIAAWITSSAAAQPPADAQTHHLMRMADICGDKIVFTYEGDLWLVSSRGGTARRLTRDPGMEVWAKFSPDGKQIAFTAQYDGGLDVYVMDAEGGVPRRLTYHPAMDRVVGWWPDGESVVFRSNRAWPSRGEEVYKVSLAGGMPERLPIDRAGLCSISPDGKSIAYNRISRESRTWKRHRGGTAQDIWMGSFEKKDYRKIIDTDWTENFPMWGADGIYFNSDREDGTLNIYKYDVQTAKVTRLTFYKDYDVKYPSIGPGQIVYQYAETLHVLDLKTGKTRMVPVQIPSDRVPMRPELVSVHPSKGSFGLSPHAKRALIEARGEILNYPVDDGEPVNLTRSPGTREKNAAWSPDGKWIAFISDRTGEEEVYLIDQKGQQPWKQLTHGGLGFRMQLVWSPDSKWLIFSDKFMRLNLVNTETGALKVIDQSDYDDAWERWGIQEYTFSPDSKWIAYTKMEQSMYESIFLYSIERSESYRLTSDITADWSPSFSPDGKYLYFLSNRTFKPVMGFVDQNHVFLNMARPYLVLLRKDAENPFAPKEDWEEVKEDEPKDAEADKDDADGKTEAAEDGGEKDAEEDSGGIDLDGIERRILVAEGVPAGNYFRLEATKKGFMYLKKEGLHFSKYDVVNDQTGGSLDLYHYDLSDRNATKVISGIANYHQSADGSKLIYRSGSKYGVVKVGSKSSNSAGRIDLSAIRIEVDRNREFLQEFDEAWRIERDWFYDPHMHGVDWQAMREKYRRFVPYCGNRSDLNYLIGEMIAELNIGHTYVWGGDLDDEAKWVPTGLLGADFDAPAGSKYYRIAHIVPNVPGDPSNRSPLDEPGCPVKQGDYLIAIDGRKVTTADNLYAFLQDKRGKVIRLTYNDKPDDEGARTVLVKTITSERGIRYREWVASNRAYVDKMTGGQVGYVHLPDMMQGGLIEFAKVWYPLYYKKAFIIDERYNGGGFTGDMIIDRLERRIWAMDKPREGKISRDPERVFVGPWVVLVNEDTGSNGEMFAEAIKIKKMAPIIGMRTWGGSIGIEAHQDLMDGGTVTPPQFGLYTLDGRWPIEGRGVEPDVEVQNMPGDVLRGKDAQLDEAIHMLLDEIKKHPVELPGPPPYPNKARPRGS